MTIDPGAFAFICFVFGVVVGLLISSIKIS